MTILQKPRQAWARHARKGWYRFGRVREAVRHTDVWEHENFEEEQARWERSDPEYARICEDGRQAKGKGEEASWRADEAKAAWEFALLRSDRRTMMPSRPGEAEGARVRS